MRGVMSSCLTDLSGARGSGRFEAKRAGWGLDRGGERSPSSIASSTGPNVGEVVGGELVSPASAIGGAHTPGTPRQPRSTASKVAHFGQTRLMLEDEIEQALKTGRGPWIRLPCGNLRGVADCPGVHGAVTSAILAGVR